MVCQLPAGNDTTSTAVYKDETSSSEDEDDFQTEIDGTVLESVNNVSLPNGIVVNDSSYVHIGNKTYNGNVTIKQFVYPGCSAHSNDVDLSDEQWNASDGDNKVYNKSDDKDYNHENRQNTYVDAGKPDVLSGLPTRWCLVLAGLVILLATVALIVSTLFTFETLRQTGNSDGGRKTPSTPTNDSARKPEKTEIDGLWMVKKASWGAMDPTGPLDTLKTPVERVIIGHTVSPACTSFANCTIRVFSTQRYHMETLRWYDIGYNFMVGGDGNVYECLGWDIEGSHTYHYNKKSIGIGVIGKFHLYKPNEKLINATQLLIQLGVKLGKISENYKLNPQCKIRPTISPGRFFVDIMKDWPHYEENTPYNCTF